MNETNITPRQKLILNLVSSAEGLLREEIQREVEKTHKISKPTLIRDLNELRLRQLIKVKGRGKGTRYYPVADNPLLKPFDIDGYFAQEPDKRRGVRKSFNFEVFEHLSGLLTPLEVEELRGGYKSFEAETGKLGQEILKRELERFVIELSWKSAKIEGNTYTLLETEELIKRHRRAKGRSQEEAIMILNHKQAFEEILKSKSGFKQISMAKIDQLHNLMVKDLGISYGIRNQAVGITGTAYKPLDNQWQIKETMGKLIEVVNKNENVVEKALVVSAMLPYIQPYADGNKRTARMLANAILLADDYYPLSYRSVDGEKFKRALILFYEQNSLYQLKRLVIEQLEFAWETYFR